MDAFEILLKRDQQLPRFPFVGANVFVGKSDYELSSIVFCRFLFYMQMLVGLFILLAGWNWQGNFEMEL